MALISRAAFDESEALGLGDFGGFGRPEEEPGPGETQDYGRQADDETPIGGETQDYGRESQTTEAVLVRMVQGQVAGFAAVLPEPTEVLRFRRVDAASEQPAADTVELVHRAAPPQVSLACKQRCRGSTAS